MTSYSNTGARLVKLRRAIHVLCLASPLAFMCPLVLAVRAASTGPHTSEPDNSRTVQFNRDIRPILSDKCFTCHGPDAANRKTKLRFDIESGSRIGLNKGGFAIVPGSPEKSEMIRRITAGD